jgi:hypothetical protein
MKKLKSKITGIVYYLYHFNEQQDMYMVKNGTHYTAKVWTYTATEFNERFEIICDDCRHAWFTTCCEKCGDRLEKKEAEDKFCDMCDGEGEIHDADFSDGDSDQQMFLKQDTLRDCPKCEGSGKG